MNKQVSKPYKMIALFAAMLLFLQVPVAMANTLSNLKEQQQQAANKTSEIQSSLKQKKSQINSNENKQETLLTQIQTLDSEIVKTNDKISSVAQDIHKATKEIDELKVSIDALMKKIEERDALLRERVRAVQENGTVSYLDVLLGANSFVDFIDRFSAVSTLMDADREIMREQKKDKETLEEQKYLIESKRNKLEENKSELVRLKSSLDSQKSQKNTLIDELEQEQANLRSEKALLEDQYSEALQIEDSLQQKIASEQKRIAAIARQEELRRKQQQQSQSNSGDVPVSTGGSWMKPANGVLTSGYGWRNIGSGSEFHYGVDIANSTGTPVVAAADGVVSYAAPLSTYGNVVIITHSVDGQIYTTVYAHLNSFNVGVGTVVSQGQQIGGMGHTGRAFGTHVHFEVHIGEWVNQKHGVQNPLRYINL